MSGPRPDERAPLEEDRDFLLGSLADLEAEWAAGDLDDADYHALKADYTTRAAAVIRALQGDSEPTAADLSAEIDRAPTGRIRRFTVGAIVVVAVAAAAGLALARFSGSRAEGDSITGDIRSTSRELLFDAQQAFAQGDVDEAFAIYDRILEEDPSNVEALTYRGWLASRTGDLDAAVADLDDAIAIDPDYPDAHAFRAVAALDAGDADTAAAELERFEELNPPPFARQLLVEAQVRERIALARVDETLLADPPTPFAETDLTVADVSAAAEALAATGELLAAVQLFDAVLAEDADNVEALAYRGWLIARAGDDQLLEAGIEQMTAALVIDPDYAPALVFRAFARNEAGDPEGARADLERFDALPDRPIELMQLVEDFGLRETVGLND